MATMIRKHQKTTPSGKKVKMGNKSLTFHAHVGDAHQSEKETKQLQSPTRTPKALANGHDDMLMYNGDVFEDKVGSNWSQVLYHGSAIEDELSEKTKTWNMYPYQLQQWQFETSNANITLAERLEKSKWKYEREREVEG